MKIDKERILEFLRSRQEQDTVAQAQPELPDQVDTDDDAAMLAHLGIDPQELLDEVSSDRGGSGG